MGERRRGHELPLPVPNTREGELKEGQDGRSIEQGKMEEEEEEEESDARTQAG